MRAPLPAFDPFYRGWQAFEQEGLTGVEALEAPIVMHAVDLVDRELADRLTQQYAQEGLQATDLRFGIWADAFPVPARDADEPIGMHLNTFGARQVRYGAATEVERAGLDVITFEAAELVRDALRPAHGVAQFQFGEQVPTMHNHIVAREKAADGLHWEGRSKIDVAARHAMRDRLASAMTPDRLEDIAQHVTTALGRFAVG